MIRQRRVNLGLTVAEACRISGMQHPTWLHIEKGETANPQIETVRRMLTALNLQIEFKAMNGPAKWTQEQLPTSTPNDWLRGDG